MSSLKNKVIISTRPVDKSDSLPDALIRKGAIVIEMPMIEISPVELIPEIEKHFHEINQFDWLIFTSKNGVRYFFQTLEKVTGYKKLPDKIRTAVVGKKTAGELNIYGVVADIICSGNLSEDLLNDLKIKKCIHKNERVFLALGNLAGDILEKGISDLADVSRINIYKTTKPKSVDQKVLKRIRDEEYDLILFTSPSGFINFIGFIGKDVPSKHLKLASIGKTTSAAIIKEGYKPLFTAKVSDGEGLVKEMEGFYSKT